MSEAGRALRVTSDTLLNDLDALAALEEEKRAIDPDDGRIVDLSARIEALARRVLEETTQERRLTVRMHQRKAAGIRTGDRAIERTPRSLAAILDLWRQAERELAGTIAGSAEAEVARVKVERLREEYRQAYEERQQR